VKLKLDMNFNDALWTMSEGNPGAIGVMMDGFRYADDIDPEGMGGWGFLINLDAMGIYGSRIWCLYKDVCGESLSKSIGLVRSVQMGVIQAETLNAAIDGKGSVHIERTLEKLKERLPSFKG